MKKKLKIFPTSISFVLILVLSACGGQDISGTVSGSSENTTITGEVAQTAVSSNETSIPTESSYEMGSTNGGTYTSDFIGIGCTLDENWTFYNDEQLAEVSGLAVDAIQDEELSDMLAESMESGTVICDMYASSSDGLATINIMIANIGVVAGVTMSEDVYIDSAVDSTQQTLSSSGYSNITVERTSVELAGENHAALVITGEFSDIPVCETMICIKKGSYMACVTLCSFTEDITPYLASLFYSVE